MIKTVINERKTLPIKTAHTLGRFILPNGQTYDLDDRKTGLNSNVLVVGTSGGGKTYKYVRPNIEACVGSYIIADTKGSLAAAYKSLLEKNGYTVITVDFVHPEDSAFYNPLNYVSCPDDVVKLSHQIISLAYDVPSTDPFWQLSAEMLLSAMIGYAVEGGNGVERSMTGVMELVGMIDVEDWEDGKRTKIDEMFDELDVRCMKTGQKRSWSRGQLMKFAKLSRKTMSCIVATLQSILQAFDTYGIRDMMSGGSVDFSRLAFGRTAVFVNISDIDRSKDLIANIFYTQAMSELCRVADEECEGNRLPVPIRFILDDFGTNCRISGFENMISNIRSRGISASVILQDTSQLFRSYADSAHTIISDCDTIVYMGGNDKLLVNMISCRADVPEKNVLNMPTDSCYVMRRGEAPVFSRCAQGLPCRAPAGFTLRAEQASRAVSG